MIESTLSLAPSYQVSHSITKKERVKTVLNLFPPHLSSERIKLDDLAAAAAKSLPSCQTLCDPIDGSPAGSTIPGILQARTLEWVAISYSNA